jgi:hypothetical protein
MHEPVICEAVRNALGVVHSSVVGDPVTMKLVPRVLLISIAALGMTGCRNFGTAPPPRLLPPPEPRTSFNLQDFVEEHNRNAELVQSLQAKTPITVRTTKKFSRFAGGAPLSGTMVMERPRNFKLELKADSGMRSATVADIGSNDSEFWFMNPDEKSIYTCKYEELPSTPLAVSFQPDWIVDALGLRVISAEEAREIKVRTSKDGKSTELVFPPRRANGQNSTRVITVSNQNGRIKSHHLYGADKKTILAQAEVSEYQEAPVDDTAASGATSTEVLCLLPKQIRLEWKQEQVVLDVNLKEVQLNSFDPKHRDAVFVEPDMPEYARVNLARSHPSAGETRGDTTIRESLPPPERGVRFSKPIPEADESSSTSEDDDPGYTASRGRNRATSSLEERPMLEVPLRARPPQAPHSYDFQLADSLRGDNPPAANVIER